MNRSLAKSDGDTPLAKAFLTLWLEEYSERDLPAGWYEQVAAWIADGIVKRDLVSYCTAWSHKRRIEVPGSLWRYLQVCCFNKTHPNAHNNTRRRDVDWVDVEPWGNISGNEPWLNRDPGGWV